MARLTLRQDGGVLRSIYIYLIRYLYLELLYQYSIWMQNIAVLRSDKLKKLALRSAVGETRFTTEERTQTSSCHNTVQWYRRGGSNTVQFYHNGQVRRQHHHQPANPLFHPSTLCLWGSWTLSLEAAVVGQFDRTVTSDSEVLILILANLHSAAKCATCQLEVTAWGSWQPAVNARPKLTLKTWLCCVTWSACIL